MNVQGKGGFAAGIVGAVTALLLTHAAAADDVMIVYGKRMVKPEATGFAEPAMEDTDGILVALHDELRISIQEDIQTSLRDGFDALRMEMAKDQGEAARLKVASLDARRGV